MTLSIDKNIPLPTKGAKGRPAIYPFADMEVGDSFAVPIAGESGGRNPNGNQKWDLAARRVCNASGYYKKLGRKFSIRTLKGEGVIRCWRVK